ncbi:MAG TPA: DnaJ domain-containing protein [Spirochaetota bacterium]|nr:DnaJ domain-containing protein [Spirochaetota bacterium]HPP04028.1 DnaJ domain-containing protein [Spirochaetota bacterium]
MFVNNNENYYEILNIKKDATLEEIKKSYKDLVKKYHPDLNKDENSEMMFKNILKAYTILTDSDLRKEYDESFESSSKKISKFIQKKSQIFKKINIFFKNIYETINKKVYINEIEQFFLNKINSSALNLSLEEIELRLLYSQNEYLRAIAAIVLGYKAEKKSIGLLEKSLEDESVEVRLCAAWALGNLGMKKSIKKLKNLYENSNTRLKIISLYSIFKIAKGSPRFCNDIIKNALNNDNEDLKEFAKNLDFYIKNDKINYESKIFDFVKNSYSENAILDLTIN